MADITSPDGIAFWTTDPADSASLVAESAQQASSIQAAFDKRQNFDFRWADAAARTAQSGMVYGSQGFQVDTGVVYFYTGSVWALWDKPYTAFTPTISGSNIGSTGTNTAFWSMSSGRAFVEGQIVLGGTGISMGSTTVTTPVTAVTGVTSSPRGQVALVDAGSSTYMGTAFYASATTVSVLPTTVSGSYITYQNITSTVPFTWVAGDAIRYSYSFIPA